MRQTGFVIRGKGGDSSAFIQTPYWKETSASTPSDAAESWPSPFGLSTLISGLGFRGSRPHA